MLSVKMKNGVSQETKELINRVIKNETGHFGSEEYLTLQCLQDIACVREGFQAIVFKEIGSGQYEATFGALGGKMPSPGVPILALIHEGVYFDVLAPADPR